MINLEAALNRDNERDDDDGGGGGDAERKGVVAQ